MIYCSICGTSNRDGSKFCNDCGASLREGGVTCPKCQARNPLISRFCGVCGKPLPAFSRLTPQNVLTVPESPLSLSEIDDELPPLEADVPLIPTSDSVIVEPVAEALPESGFPISRSATSMLGDQSVKEGWPNDLQLTDEDLSVIEWYEAGEDIASTPYSSPSAVSMPAKLAWFTPLARPVRTLPAWLELSEEAASPAGQEQPIAPLAERVLPGWIDILDMPTADRQQDSMAMPASPVFLLPAWLDLPEEAVADGRALPVESPLEPQSVELPPWLWLPEPAPSPPPSTAASPRTLPDWLGLPEPVTLPPAADLQRALPSWLDLPDDLQEHRTSEALPSWLFFPEPDRAVERALPEWLFMEEGAGPVVSPPAISRVLPDWLDLAETDTLEPHRELVLPDWLDLPESVTLPPADLQRALPSWLDLPDALREHPTPEALPSWLFFPEPDRRIQRVLPEWLFVEEGAEPVVSPPTISRALPDWLDLAETDTLEPHRELVLPNWLDLAEPPAQGEPLSQVQAEASPPTLLSPVIEQAPTSDFPLGTTIPLELPDWLFTEESPSSLPNTPPVLPSWLSAEELPSEEAVDQPLEVLSDGGGAVPATTLTAPVAEETIEAAVPLVPMAEETTEITAPSSLIADETIEIATPPALIADETIEIAAPPATMAEETIEIATPSALTADVTTEIAAPSALMADENTQALPPPVLVVEEATESVADVPLSGLGRIVAPVASDQETVEPELAEAEDTIVSQGIALARPLQTSLPPVRKPVEWFQVSNYAAVFSDILQPKTEPLVAPSPPSVHRFSLISVLLIVVVSFPLLVPMWINIESRQPASDVFKTIQGLPATANVLVSFDWTAGTNDEMSPIAEAIVRHLVQKKVRIIAVSLVPEGAKLAQRVLDKSVLSKSKGYIYGEGVVNLGYLPGSEAAIQKMSSDFARAYGVDYHGTPSGDLPLIGEVKSIENIDLVIEFSGEPEILQKWVTQLWSRYPEKRIVAGISAAVLPWAQPFTAGGYEGQLQQVKGIVTGIRGAAEYEWESNDPNDSQRRLALAALDAQSLGSIFFVLVIVFGNLAYLRGQRNRSKLARAQQRRSPRS